MGDKEEKKERRFSLEQYEMLRRCSDKRDMTEWNEWREKNRNTEIHLEGANLTRIMHKKNREDREPVKPWV